MHVGAIVGSMKHFDLSINIAVYVAAIFLAIVPCATFSIASAQTPVQSALPESLRNIPPEQLAIMRESNRAADMRDRARELERAGQFAEALRSARDALEIYNRIFPDPRHPHTFDAILLAARLNRQNGEYVEAERLYLTALRAVEEAVRGGGRAAIAPLNNLALFYRDQGRDLEAIPLFQRAIEIIDAALPRNHEAGSNAHLNYAGLLRRNNFLDLAQEHYDRARAIDEANHDEDNLTRLSIDTGLALLEEDRGNLESATALLAGIVQRHQQVPRAVVSEALVARNNLGTVYFRRRMFAEAIAVLRPAFDDSVRTLGPRASVTLLIQQNLVSALVSLPAGGPEVLELARSLAAAEREDRSRPSALQGNQAGAEARLGRASPRLTQLADAAWQNGNRSVLAEEAYLAVQDAMSGGASNSISRPAARRLAAALGPNLQASLRQRDLLEARWERLALLLSNSYQSGSSAAQSRQALLAERDQLGTELTALSAQIQREFPRYSALVSPRALSVRDTQAILSPTEAVLMVLPTGNGTHILAVSSTGISWHRSDWTEARLRQAVARLRYDVGARTAASLQQRRYWDRSRPRGVALTFSRQLAFELHQELIAPVAAALTGRTRLYVAAGGVLSGLPFSILVTASPQGNDYDAGALRNTAWFAEAYALVHVPTVQSLQQLRQQPQRPSAGANSFVGFGDPVLNGANQERGPSAAAEPLQRSQAAFSARAASTADQQYLLGLSRLGGTALEVEAVRVALGAPESSVFLAERATETAVRYGASGGQVAAARLLLFSTHGLMPSEAPPGAREAGIVFTPPPAGPSEYDDGYLTASEVATLQLDADWVVLSACNTATGEGDEGEGISRLARSFFYAGARNLLASHWYVEDNVAPVLIARTVSLVQGGMGRPEALQTAIREIRADTSGDARGLSRAHPYFWAPFVLIGR